MAASAESGGRPLPSAIDIAARCASDVYRTGVNTAARRPESNGDEFGFSGEQREQPAAVDYGVHAPDDGKSTGHHLGPPMIIVFRLNGERISPQ